MRFLPKHEAAELAQQITSSPTVLSDPHSAMESFPGLQVVFEAESAGRFYWLAQQIAASLEYFDWCLLCVTQTEVWPSSENLHLYYALRRSYGEQGEIDQTPGQKFLRHELADLVSFIHIGMLNGWDMLLCTSHDYGRVFVSHDGWAEFVRPNGATLGPLETIFAEASLKFSTLRPAS
jgi:hypothetical protein